MYIIHIIHIQTSNDTLKSLVKLLMCGIPIQNKANLNLLNLVIACYLNIASFMFLCKIDYILV